MDRERKWRQIMDRGIAILLISTLFLLSVDHIGIQRVEAASAASIPNANMNSLSSLKIANWSQESDVAKADGGISTNNVLYERISLFNYAAKVTKVCKGDVRLKSSAMTAEDGQMLYRVGGKVKTENASGRTNLHLQVRYEYQDAEGNVIRVRNVTVAARYGGSDGSYQDISGVFRWDKGATNIYLVFCMSDSQDGIYDSASQTTMYVDDTYIEAVSETEANTGFDSIDGLQEEYVPTYGYAATEEEFTFESTADAAYSGEYGLHVQKDGYNAESYLAGYGKFMNLANEGILCTDEMTYTWGMYVKSRNSNAFVRMDLDVYNSENRFLGTLRGSERMLSRSSEEGEWIKLSTSEVLPEGVDSGSYATYRIVVTQGKADICLDNLFGKITETYYEKIADWSEFDSTNEWENAVVAQGVGTVTAGSMSRKVETLIPGASYEIMGKYSASQTGKITVDFYDLEGQVITHSKELGVKETLSGNKEVLDSFLVPEGTVYATIHFGGEGNYALSEYVLCETAGRAAENSWKGQWIWYPENPVKDGQNATRYFKKTFSVSDRTGIANAFLQIAADEELVSITVNGNVVSEHYSDSIHGSSPYVEADKRPVNVYEITEFLTEGNNTLEVTVFNQADYGGLLYEVELYRTGESEAIRYVSDETTEVSRDGTRWEKARKLGSPEYGEIAAVAYWRRVVEYDSASVLTINHGFMGETLSGTAGETITYHSTGVQMLSDAEKATFDGQTFTGRLYDATDRLYYAVVPVKMTVGETNGVADFGISIPDYAPEGTYELRMDSDEMRLLWNATNLLCTLEVRAKNTVTLSEAGVSPETKLLVNGEETSPVMYLRPNLTGLYDYDKMSAFRESGVKLYVTYNGYLNGDDYAYKKYAAANPEDYVLWQRNDDAGNPVLNYKWFDYEILRTLDLNADTNTKLIVNLCVDAPDWWTEAHRDTDCMKYMDSNGETHLLVTHPDEAALTGYQVSMASAAYQKDVSKVIRAITEHMTEASYAGRIIGIRLVAGRTYEWMQYGVESGQLIDYSEATLTGFRSWLQERYGSADALQEAWDDSSVTFENASIPTAGERNPDGETALLNAGIGSQKKTIDYNTFLGETSARYLVKCADAAKGVRPEWLVGAYNGYSWNFTSSEAIGSAHTASSIVLQSDCIDFISSPMNYGERLEGYATGHMALSDSVQAAGKLYLLEMDNRTLHAQINGSSADSVGMSDTVQKTIRQITRDMSLNFVRGTGMWFYDMNGGWFEDDSIEARIRTIKEEYDRQYDLSSNNEVAVFVAEDNYNYLTADIVGNDTGRTTYLLSALYEEQRRELSAMGASYDIFSIADVTEGRVTRDYKLNIVLSPFELTDEECTLLNAKFAKNHQVVLWIYLPGISDGTGNAAEHLKRLVDMDVTYFEKAHALQAEVTGTIDGTSSDAVGTKYGNSNAKTGPWVSVSDSNAAALAVYTSGETAAAYVEKEDYTSVYSAVPDVPAQFLRMLCEKAGVHQYSDDMSDVVETNKSYIAIHSINGGEKTIHLNPKNWNRSVYDVIDAEELDIVDNTFTCIMKAGETRLYRVKSEESISGGMDWSDTAEDPDNPNLFYNGTFDEADGTANQSGWAAGNLGNSESQVVTEDVFVTEYGMDFEEKEEKTGLESSDMMDWALEGNGAILGFVKENTNHVLKVDKPTAYRYIRYYGYTFMPGETYRVSFRAKSTDQTGLQVNGVTGNWTDEKSITLTSDWQRFESEFSVSGKISDYYIKFMESGKNGTIYLDDFQIEKLTPVSKNVYTEGYGTFGESDNVLMVERKEEFWNYGTQVQEGKSYKYQLQIKIEDAKEDFSFEPYLYDFVNGTFIPLNDLKRTENCDWTEISCQFVAPAVHETDGVRFGFVRRGTGKVYVDDVELYEVRKETVLPESDTLVNNGNTLADWQGATPISCFAGPDGGLGVGAKGREISTVFKERKPLKAGCEYVLQFRADVSNADALLVTVGNVRLKPNNSITEESGWKDFICTFTPTVVTEQKIVFSGEGAEISLDDVVLYRKYELGDSNGDGEVNSKDMVRYKRHVLGKGAQQYKEVATYVFSDITGTKATLGFDRNGITIDEEDIKEWRKMCCSSF